LTSMSFEIYAFTMTMQVFTLLLALWGALLSTVLTVIKVLSFYQERSIIKLKLFPGMKIIPKTTEYGDRSYLIVKATNIGKNPITLETCVLLLPRKDSLTCIDKISFGNIELTMNRTHQYIFDEEDLNEEYNLPRSKYIAVVFDSSRKAYYSHNIIMRYIKLRRFK